MGGGCSVWGVLNVTPDSFSDGGTHFRFDSALARARTMLAEGANVIDIGGESSRPPGRDYGSGASQVTVEEELRRVIPVIEEVARGLGAVVSIDTVKAPVAEAALRAGATIINDVSGGSDPELLRVTAQHGVDLVLMHNRARGEVSPATTDYGDVVEDVRAELLERVARAVECGVARERIWIDPGIGFAKTPVQSLRLLARTARIVDTGFRVLVGASRKSFIAHAAFQTDGSLAPPSGRLGGSLAAVTMAVLGGAHGVRVHDVLETVQAVRVAEAGRAQCSANT